MPDHPEPSESLAELAMLGLDHGVSSVEEGGPLVPFVLEDGPKGRNLQRFVADTLEESVAQARKHAASNRAKAQRVAVAWDGFITIEGARSDAILVQAFEAGDPCRSCSRCVTTPRRASARPRPSRTPCCSTPPSRSSDLRVSRFDGISHRIRCRYAQ